MKNRDSERRLRVKLLVDKSRHFGEILAREDRRSSQIANIRTPGSSRQGLPIAHCTKWYGPTSFDSRDEWNRGIDRNVSEGLDHCDGNRNSRDHRHSRSSNIASRRAPRLGSSSAVGTACRWQCTVAGSTRFASSILIFPPAAEEQIRSFNGNHHNFKAICRGLYDLQTYCETWTTPNFDIHAF